MILSSSTSRSGIKRNRNSGKEVDKFNLFFYITLMGVLQFDAVFKCPNCKIRVSRCTPNYRCIKCNEDVKDEVNNAINSVNGITMLIPILIVVFILLKVLL